MDESELHDLIERAFAALAAEDYVRGLGHRRSTRGGSPRPGSGSRDPRPGPARRRRGRGVRTPRPAAQSNSIHKTSTPTACWRWRPGGPSGWRWHKNRFELAIARFGKHPALLSDYAWFMATERGPKLAEAAAHAAIEADAASSTAWAALGLAQFRLHRRGDAEASLRRALELNPNDIYAQSAMVTLLQEQRRGQQGRGVGRPVGRTCRRRGSRGRGPRRSQAAANRANARRAKGGPRRGPPPAPHRRLGLGLRRRSPHRPVVLVFRSAILAHRFGNRGRVGDCAVQTLRLGAVVCIAAFKPC